MAKPIEATPPVVGEDATALLASLARHATPDEMRRRIEHAKKRTAQAMIPKHPGADVGSRKRSQ